MAEGRRVGRSFTLPAAHSEKAVEVLVGSTNSADLSPGPRANQDPPVESVAFERLHIVVALDRQRTNERGIGAGVDDAKGVGCA